MLWDASYDSWAVLGVSSQPTAVLFAADGSVITGWRGMFPEDDVLRLAAENSPVG
jgi:thioredoxin-like negative regulator of GroEL